MYKRFEELLESSNMKASHVAKELGFAPSTLSDWKNGKSVPKADKMEQIANYFNVSIDWLCGRTDTKISADAIEGIDGVYLNFAKSAQDEKIDPEDIMMAIEFIRKSRGK